MGDQILYWLIIALAVISLYLNVRRNRKRKQYLVLMARPMTRYEREKR